MTRLLKPLSGVVGAGFKYNVRSTDMSLKATNDYTTVDLSGAVNVLKINNQSGMVKQITVKATSYSISFKVADLGDLTPGNYTMELWSQKDGTTTVYPDTSASVTNITIGSMHLDGLDSPVATVFIKSFENATPEYIEDARAKMDAYNVHAEMRNNAIYVNGFMVLDLNPQSPSSNTGGSAGIKGDTGDSAYDLWLKQGHSGTLQDYLNWTKGEQGIQGAPGRDGEGTMYWQWVDLTASKFDQNKWYPVVKNGGVPATKFNVFAASHELDPGEFKPSWATHKNGFTVSCRYLANYPAWGAIPTNGIIEAEEGYFISDETCPVHFDIHAQNGGYVFYLRGGARYQLGDNLRNMTWQVYDGTYSANGISFDPLDKEPVSFKRTYNNWPTRTKIIDLPALAELGGGVRR